MHLTLANALGSAALNTGGLVPPAGFVFLVDEDGTYLTDNDGYYRVEQI